MSRQEVHIVACVTEDNYIRVEGVYSDYDKASNIVNGLMENDPDVEWELLSEYLE